MSAYSLRDAKRIITAYVNPNNYVVEITTLDEQSVSFHLSGLSSDAFLEKIRSKILTQLQNYGIAKTEIIADEASGRKIIRISQDNGGYHILKSVELAIHDGLRAIQKQGSAEVDNQADKLADTPNVPGDKKGETPLVGQQHTKESAEAILSTYVNFVGFSAEINSSSANHVSFHLKTKRKKSVPDLRIYELACTAHLTPHGIDRVQIEDDGVITLTQTHQQLDHDILHAVQDGIDAGNRLCSPLG